MAIADVLRKQLEGIDAAVVQVDEANLPGSPEDGPWAAEAINHVLKGARGQKAVHLCFGNYGGQTIQSGTWEALIAFLNALHADHLVLELAHRPKSDLDALRELRPGIGVGVGVVDIKVNHIETPDEIAMALERAEQALGPNRVRYAHPDCGFWMLKRSVADRKIAALVKGRDLYLGRS
jgi:5-methyltetrahydropteroyltriglutamate--homocysteine methyltransferase